LAEDYAGFSVLNQALEYHGYRRGEIFRGSHSDWIVLLNMLA
jgi:hypothetical protein